MQPNRIVRFLLILIPILVAGVILYWLGDIVAYILIAWVISMLGSPVMLFLEKHLRLGRIRGGRSIAAVLTLLLFLCAVAGIGLLFIPVFLEQAVNLSRVNMHEVLQALEEPIQQLVGRLRELGLVEGEFDLRVQLHDQFVNWFEPARINELFGSLISLVSFLGILIGSVLFIAFFFLKEQGLFTQFLKSFVPNRVEGKVAHTVDEVSILLTKYFGGIVLQITIITIYVSVLLTILGVRNALLIAFFAALINLIPYLGPIIGGTIGILLTLTSHVELPFYTELMPLLFNVLLVFVTMQMIDNLILQPVIFSKQVRAHPLEIFIIIMVGSKVGGILGMVLAIPVYTVIRVIIRVFFSEFEIFQKIAAGLKNQKE